ncbi:putative signal peptide protein [Puccinia sorghi]|uniref:Putative signal peptide protein n=1 Tax=Puccinia sorghi TaxID=27349 RepID=A0A0L6U558_9BASI|nr:putative signal peptide protein [Puccinia sorghi]
MFALRIVYFLFCFGGQDKTECRCRPRLRTCVYFFKK